MSIKEKKQKKNNNGAGGFFAAGVPLLGFLLFGIIPLLLSLVVAFTELHSTDLTEMKFIGLDNFINIITDGDKYTYASYFSTVVYALNVPICIGISIYVANLLNNTKIGKKFFRSVFFVPYVCSSVVITLTFRMLFNEEVGILNKALTSLGFKEVGWLTESAVSFMAVAIIMSVWSGIGWCVVLYQAALANVDQGYYEAARIDGATPRQIFWKITWPAVTPTTAFLFTIKLMGALQAMAETHLLTTNASVVPKWEFLETNAWVSDLVVKHIYNMLFTRPYQYGYGMAAAAGWVLAIIVFIVTRINMKLQERWVNYDF